MCFSIIKLFITFLVSNLKCESKIHRMRVLNISTFYTCSKSKITQPTEKSVSSMLSSISVSEKKTFQVFLYRELFWSFVSIRDIALGLQLAAFSRLSSSDHDLPRDVARCFHPFEIIFYVLFCSLSHSLHSENILRNFHRLLLVFMLFIVSMTVVHFYENQ